MKKAIAIVMMLALIFTAACAAPPPAAPAAPAPAAEPAEPAREEEAGESAPAMPAPAAPAPAMPAPEAPAYDGEWDQLYGEEYRGRDSETYQEIEVNRTMDARTNPLTTISLKVDTAAYTNVARYIRSGSMPPPDAVRTEELINYFSYDEPLRFGRDPFAIYTEIGPSPFSSGKYMALVRVKSRDIDKSALPPSNLTFLIDTSGSMADYDKLPLLQEAFDLLADTLGERDRVSIVTYAGSSEIALHSVSGADKAAMRRAIYSLTAGGSTAGANGIMTAYELAESNFLQGGNNRVILATDGDFNVGLSDVDSLNELISRKRDSGVYLSVLGFGTGNLRDDMMETLATNGNGNYSYIDSVRTAQKVLVDELASNLFTIADDVKAQVEFNPANVRSYRMIGYENRTLANEDFADDTKDAGEIGVGTDVVVMFELELESGSGPSLKYQDNESLAPAPGAYGDEFFEVRIRYKNPGESRSIEMIQPAKYDDFTARNTSDFTFACCVAAFGDALRDGRVSYDQVQSLYASAADALGRDEGGYRADFLELLGEMR